MKLLVTFLDRLVSASGALLLTQLPMFMLQYTQQLAGRGAELSIQLNEIQRLAAGSGKSLPEYIQKFLHAKDSDFSKHGELINFMVERYEFLTMSEAKLASASAISKPFVFLHDLDWEIATSTWQHFQFGIPFNLEGLAYGVIGLVLGGILFQSIRWMSQKSLGLVYSTIPIDKD